MPTQIQTPSGLVEFPDGMSMDDIKGVLQKKFPAPNTAVDMARSIPGGLARGTASIIGLPGDVASLEKNPDYPSSTPFLHQMAQALNPANVLPTSQTIGKAISAPFGGFYEPKTTAGQYTETAASFAPAALAPGSIPQRIGRVLAPSVASETAGQLTKGTPIEPYARAAGALLGGGLQGLGEGFLAERAQTAATPTTAQVRGAADQAYQSFRGHPVTVTPQMQAAIGGDMGHRAIGMALEGADANREAGLMGELQSLLGPNPPAQITVDAADRVSQAMRDIGRGAMRGEEPNANLARGAFGRRTDVETAVQQVPGINEARALWARGRNSEEIDAALGAAQRQSQTPAGAGGLNQAVRREVGKLVRDEDFMRGLSHPEQEALMRVSNGSFTANALQQLGKFSPIRNHIAGMAELLAGTAGGMSPEMIGLAAGGEAARQGGTMATMRNARLASELLRSGGTSVPQIAGPTVQGLLQAGVLAPRSQALGSLLYAPRQETR